MAATMTYEAIGYSSPLVELRSRKFPVALVEFFAFLSISVVIPVAIGVGIVAVMNGLNFSAVFNSGQIYHGVPLLLFATVMVGAALVYSFVVGIVGLLTFFGMLGSFATKG